MSTPTRIVVQTLQTIALTGVVNLFKAISLLSFADKVLHKNVQIVHVRFKYSYYLMPVSS